MYKTDLFNRILLVLFSGLLIVLPVSTAAVESFVCLLLLNFLVFAFAGESRGALFKELFCNRFALAAFIFWLTLIPCVIAAGEYRSISFEALFTKWGEGIIIFVITYFAALRHDPRRLIKFLLAGAAVVCVDGIIQKISGTSLLRGYPLHKGDSGSLGAVTGAFGHYNDFAGYLLIPFFLSLGLVFEKQRTKKRLIYAAVSMLIAVNIIFTCSRAGWLSVLCGFIAALAVFSGKQRGYILSIFILCGLTVWLMPDLRERFMFIFKPGGDSDRLRIWAAGLKMFLRHPLVGYGLNTFPRHLVNQIEIYPMYAHNCYLQILVEAGVIGFLGFCVFTATWLVTSIKYIAKFQDNIIINSLFCGLVAYSCVIFFDTQLYSLRTAVLFWIFTAVQAGYATSAARS